jgi:hypothetical protein
MGWVSINVDLDDIYYEMDRYDKQKMAEWLFDDGILDDHPNHEIRKVTRGTNESPGEEQYRNDLTKLWNGYYQLSNEDIEIIKNIANKI